MTPSDCAPVSALDTPLPETARVSIERPTWGEIGEAIVVGLVLAIFLFGLPGIFGGM